MSATTSQATPTTTAAEEGPTDYWDERRKHALISAYQVWYLETGIIGFATLINVASVLWAWKQRRAMRRRASRPPADHKAVTESSGTSDRVSMKRLPAAALAAARIPSFRWRIPFVHMTIVELVMTLGYIAGIFIWDFVHSQGLSFSSIQAHAANMATAQFPIIVALAMKNNAIEYLTGISHEKLNLMHRVISRVILIQIWIHGAAIIRAGSIYVFYDTWRWMGLISGISFAILTLLSIKPIRQRFYEFFWITHVIFVIIFLIGAMWHCSADLGYPYHKFIYSCFIIWGQDRLCRYIRYLVLTWSPSRDKRRAHLEVLSDDTLRITVRRSFYLPLFAGRGALAPGAGWKAGQHMFLAFPTLGPLESHPFTIAAFSEPLDAPADAKPNVHEREIMWIVRTRDGLTRRLYDHAAAAGGSCDLYMFMDGPYGAPPDISGFDTCVFIAGGSGVAYTIPRMREILTEAAKGAACARRVVFIWAIRHAAHINWIAHDLRKAVATCPPDVELSILVFVTSRPTLPDTPTKPTLSCAPTLSSLPTLSATPAAPTTPLASPTSPGSPTPTVCGDIATERREASGYSASSTDSGKDSGKDDDLERGSDSTHAGSDYTIKGVDVQIGRPDIHALLKDIITSTKGAVSVDISGPEALVAATRSALSSDWAGPLAVLRGGASVQLNVEDFTM
ncbi:NADPH oxidase family protein [Phanerochaete sordida]|uniref:NADPH oxidase family protein n=1 Tax=Phanerochaete sordida TaxID=48140 RepID=A0A9P3LC11_9APHY|nr:NADPH oxidase family protein [Phanerochaete sordida]